MKSVQFIKPGLFLYECVRCIAVTFLFLFAFRNSPDLSIIIIFVAPVVLFLVMSLFIWIDADQYKAYLPLFIAGKCIGIFILLIWSIATKQVIIIQSYMISGDLFSIAAVMLINRDIQKSTETPDGG